MCSALKATTPVSKVHLIFVTPYDADTKLVDLMTGRYGYGHVAIWAGHMCNGEPCVLDSGIGYGVGFRPYSVACAAPSRSIELDRVLGRWVYCRALEQVGRDYDYVGLVRSRKPTDRFTCSGLVACCLPAHMQCELPGRCSPNDLAKMFGVQPWRR